MKRLPFSNFCIVFQDHLHHPKNRFKVTPDILFLRSEKIILYVLLIFYTASVACFSKDTLILTTKGLVEIAQLELDDGIINSYGQTEHIKTHFVLPVGGFVRLTVADQCIICCNDQLWWSLEKHVWVKACDLHAGDQLLSTFDGPLLVESVEIINEINIMYKISVDDPHELLVTPRRLIAHNIAPFIGIGLSFAFGSGTIEFLGPSLCVGIATIGSFFGAQFFKQRNKYVECRPVAGVASAQPPFHHFNKNDDDDKEKHPNGKYEGVDYHKSYRSGRKSPAPKNGQKALDRSVPINNDLRHRVSVCDGEIVILRYTGPRKYHGFTVTWEEIITAGLDKMEKIKKTLIDNNLVSKKGTFL